MLKNLEVVIQFWRRYSLSEMAKLLYKIVNIRESDDDFINFLLRVCNICDVPMEWRSIC